MKNKSFTLIELLVVIVIIGILAGVIMISTSSSITKANIAKSKLFEESVANDLAADMISRWKLDEIIGASAPYTTPDAWGSNTGTLGDGATTSTFPTLKTSNECVSSGCYSFDGGDHVDCGSGSSLNVGYDNYAFSLWFKKNTFDTVQVLLDKRMSEFVGIVLYFDTGNRLNSRGGITGQEIYFSQAIIDSNWHFVCVSNTRSGNRIINVDGISRSSSYDSSSINFNSDRSLKIGVDYVGTNYKFNGLMDDVRVYNAALSSSQIKQNYIAGLDSLLSQGTISKVDYNQKINELAYEK